MRLCLYLVGILLASHWSVTNRCIAWQQDPAQDNAAPKPILALDSGGHTSTVTRVQFTPDEKYLITSSLDKTVRIWDFTPNAAAPSPGPGRSMSRVLRPPQREKSINLKYSDGIGSLSMSKDGRWFAIARTIAGGRPEIDLISLPEGRLVATLENKFFAIADIEFSPNGKWLAVAGDFSTPERKESNLAVWDIEKRRLVESIRDGGGQVTSITWHPKSTALAAACGDGKVRIWDIASGKVVQNLKLPDNLGENFRWTSLSWNNDGKKFAMLGYGDQTLLDVINPYDGKSIKWTFMRGLPRNGSIEFAPNADRLLVNTPLGARIIDASTFEVPKTDLGVTNYRFRYEHATFSPTGRYVAIAGGDLNQVLVYEAATSQLVQSMSGTGIAMNRIGWSEDATRLAVNAHHDPKTDIVLKEPTGDAIKNLPPVRYDWGFDLVNLQSHERQDLSDTKFNHSILWKPAAYVSSILKHEEGNFIAANMGNAFMIFPIDEKTKARQQKIPESVRWKWHVTQFPHEGAQILDITPTLDGTYLATTGADQTIRIYRPGSPERILSLFFAVDREGNGGEEWIAWTEEGYYACSPGGERLMGWHVQKSSNELAEFQPAVRFRKSLYRPDIIKLVLKAGSVEKAVAEAAAAKGKQETLIKVEEVLPPQVKIIAPTAVQKINADKPFKVQAVAQSVGNHPVTALRLIVDGRPFGEVTRVASSGAAKLGDTRQEWEIQLPPGKHQIAVQAESAVSKGLSTNVEVIAIAERALVSEDQPESASQLALPSLYVLAIGISDYEKDDLKLNYAARDAEILSKTLQTSSKSLFKKIEVKLLTNTQATRKEILQGMIWLSKQMTQHDIAVVMYAGHGSKDSHGKFYLVPADYDGEDLFASGVSGEQVKAAVERLPGKVLMLLDACHAGSVGGDKRRAANSLTDDLVRDLVTDDYGVIVMCSAMGREFAHESEEVEHGYFTLALVEGLSGKGDYNKDGVVHLNELDLYTSDRVKVLAEGKQHPVTTKPTSIRSFPLSKP